MLKNKILSAAGSGEEKLYIDDLFQTWVRTGTGATTTVTNGIDLAGKGGLLWVKSRSDPTAHYLFDTARGVSAGSLSTNLTVPQNTAYSGKYSFLSNGYSVTDTSTAAWEINGPSKTYVDFVFRKSPRFFDVVTYTGNGVAGRQIPHSLGVAPGMIIVKCTSVALNWVVYHQSTGAGQRLVLNTTDAVTGAVTTWNNTSPTSSVITLGDNSAVNASGATYVAYLFAHDPEV